MLTTRRSATRPSADDDEMNLCSWCCVKGTDGWERCATSNFKLQVPPTMLQLYCILRHKKIWDLDSRFPLLLTMLQLPTVQFYRDARSPRASQIEQYGLSIPQAMSKCEHPHQHNIFNLHRTFWFLLCRTHHKYIQNTMIRRITSIICYLILSLQGATAFAGVTSNRVFVGTPVSNFPKHLGT